MFGRQVVNIWPSVRGAEASVKSRGDSSVFDSPLTLLTSSPITMTCTQRRLSELITALYTVRVGPCTVCLLRQQRVKTLRDSDLTVLYRYFFCRFEAQTLTYRCGIWNKWNEPWHPKRFLRKIRRRVKKKKKSVFERLLERGIDFRAGFFRTDNVHNPMKRIWKAKEQLDLIPSV